MPPVTILRTARIIDAAEEAAGVANIDISINGLVKIYGMHSYCNNADWKYCHFGVVPRDIVTPDEHMFGTDITHRTEGDANFYFPKPLEIWVRALRFKIVLPLTGEDFRVTALVEVLR